MDQTVLNLHLLFVNITSFLIKLFVNFSFHSEDNSRGSWTTEKSYSEIISSTLYLLKYLTVFLIIFLGKPANKCFLVTRFTSKLKLLDIPLAYVIHRLCSGSF